MPIDEIGFHILLLLLAIISNALSAIAGGGAGLIQLPVIIFLGLPFATALATHKVASVALGVGASIKHWRASSLLWPVSLSVVLGGLPGVILGARSILLIPEDLAKLSLGVLTVALGVYSFLRKSLGQQAEPKRRQCSCYVISGAACFLFGFLNGSLTSGTGLFVTLWLISWFGLDYRQATAHTLVLVGLFYNSTGAITLGMLQSIQWAWLPALIAGSLIGGYLGAHLSIVKGNQFIKRLFEVTTVAVGIKLILG
ncbi:MAG: sulfite exporter TauE/SafE family protein [Pseudomonadales bacterium]|nr:sulfite exporter TauE/SafE family protein [Pseudomonadales bacterium]